MAQSLQELAYDLSLAAVSRQESRANELRSRTGTLLAAAAVTASFFGSRAVAGSQLDPAALLALIAYLAAATAGLAVLRPREFVFEFRGSVLLATARDAGSDLDAAHETAALWIEELQDRNSLALARMGRWYARAVAAVGAEIVLWTVSFTGILES